MNLPGEIDVVDVRVMTEQCDGIGPTPKEGVTGIDGEVGLIGLEECLELRVLVYLFLEFTFPHFYHCMLFAAQLLGLDGCLRVQFLHGDAIN